VQIKQKRSRYNNRFKATERDVG